MSPEKFDEPLDGKVAPVQTAVGRFVLYSFNPSKGRNLSILSSSPQNVETLGILLPYLIPLIVLYCFKSDLTQLTRY